MDALRRESLSLERDHETLLEVLGEKTELAEVLEATAAKWKRRATRRRDARDRNSHAAFVRACDARRRGEPHESVDARAPTED